jgi:hypothetical protein
MADLFGPYAAKKHPELTPDALEKKKAALRKKHPDLVGMLPHLAGCMTYVTHF